MTVKRRSETEGGAATRAAVDQHFRKWHQADRLERIEIAKAFLVDAVQQQSEEARGFSPRVDQGLHLLSQALAPTKQCPSCRGSGKVRDE